ncbi:MAG: hypothetical protein WC763_00305 [Candidatus Paceibacterota bacterium]|jgi:hypothetical protein
MTTLESPEPQEKDSHLDAFNHCPCPQGPMDIAREEEYIHFTNELQGMLALRKFGKDPETERFAKWVEMFSVRFRDNFERTIRENPLYFDGIATIGDIGEEKWADLEEKIYN